MNKPNSLTQKAFFAQYPSLVQETSEGMCLTDPKLPKPETGIMGGFIAIVFLLVFLFIFWWFFLIVAIIGAVGGLLIPSTRHHWLANLRLSKAELLLPRHPLRLGENSHFKFRRNLKNNARTPEQGILTAKIYCVERVEYTRGSDTEIEVSVIWESQPIKSTILEGEDSLTLSAKFTIPNHLPSSFEGKHNQIRWVLSVEQNISKLAHQVHCNFTFIVDPMVIA